MTENSFSCIIIGAASAGLSAGLYLARQGVDTLIISRDVGGQALLTDDIENYPGTEQISGFDLMNKFQKQTESYGAKFVYDEVTSIKKDDDGNFTVGTRDEKYHAESVILAFGKTPRMLNVPGEEEHQGRGVSYCAVCDGPLYRGKEIGVAGIGEHGIQAATYLAGVASTLHVFYKGARAPTDDEQYQDLVSRDNVHFYINSSVREITGDGTVKGVKFTEGGKEKEAKVSGLFVEMGYIAKTDFVKNLVKLNEQNEVITDKIGKTSQEGVFACGDVTDIPYKQAVISAGQGAAAALSAYNYIQRKHGRNAVKSDWKSVKPRKQEKEGSQSAFILKK
jgi:thioredoxin reductase (NADPH)